MYQTEKKRWVMVIGIFFIGSTVHTLLWNDDAFTCLYDNELWLVKAALHVRIQSDVSRLEFCKEIYAVSYQKINNLNHHN